MIKFIVKYGSGNTVPVQVTSLKRFVYYLFFKNIMASDNLSTISAIEIKSTDLNNQKKLHGIISRFGIGIEINIPYDGGYTHIIQKRLNKSVIAKQSLALFQI